ncbi:hypothetical protein [Ferrovibrio sp.]|uniref:hypothetical protein n=1 Tax=Ferrovibrio sp. TaxID=1917215 RepID=UPI000CA923FA|nr:hypothetical protein [Ferrovibrio sp.]PJI42215.1 MAG: hypothetical protein CTR53_07200 [Ferrovibrio sp.]
MTGNPSLDDIMGAIHESGYLMEQEVATQFERRGFHVRTNVAFEDLDEGKSRELDVKAIKRVSFDDSARLSAYIELLVECKNNTNPFVFIARPKSDWDRRQCPEEFTFPYRYQMKKNLGGGRSMTRDINAFHHLGFDQVYQAHVNAWKAVQFCRIDRKGNGWHANHGGLYDAIFYPMAKALNARRSAVPQPSRPDDWRYIWLFFPLVVTSGDLFLIDSSAEVPRPTPVDHVSFERELKSGKLSGSFMVTFVRRAALEAFLDSVVDPLAMLSISLIEKRQEFLKTTDLDWSD